ncbi:unnamed protein product [Eruca vesicaria subsp. sativa]|uniref:MATH domain-containing protein n=1 Tax=Eruca vesicaria subsp. sativa TaxID=29727 RepID=A0ABC8KXV1_ERUVS|nr:unnamed protein product [Eruca vesicaria subsp. sativa]
MGEQMEKKFTWVSQNLSYCQSNKCFSRPFSLAGCNWYLSASPSDYDKGDYLCLNLELEPESLTRGWSRDVKFTFTLVNKGWRYTNKTLGMQRCFDAKNNVHGFEEFLPLSKLWDTRERFMVNYRLIVIAEIHVLPAIAVTNEPVKSITEPLNCKVENQPVANASAIRPQGDSSCQVVQTVETVSKENLHVNDVVANDDSAGEGSDDDDDTSEEASDGGDSSEEKLDDDYDEDGPLSRSNALEDVSPTMGNHVVSCNGLAAEAEVSNAPKEDIGDEASSLVSNDSARNENSGGRGFNNVVSVTETGSSVLKEIQPVKETTDVNGFEVFSSQVELVSYIFKRHPDIALGFRPKNQEIRRAYMNELLSLIETLCQSPEKLSEDDLRNADDTLADLVDVGFKLDWLKIKLNEVTEKKMEQGSEARLKAVDEELQKLKLMFLDLETQVQMEKAEALAARAPLSFNDVVY